MTEPNPDHPHWVQIEVPFSLAALADRGVRAAIAMVAIVLAGFVVLALGFRGIDDQSNVPAQMPFLVSAGFGGIALIGTGGALLAVHLGRRRAAARRAALEAIIRAAATVADRI